MGDIDDLSQTSSNTKFNGKSHTFCSFSTPSIFNCLLHHISLRPNWCEQNSGFHILLFSFIALHLNFVMELHVIILFDKTEQNETITIWNLVLYFVISFSLSLFVYFFFSHHFFSSSFFFLCLSSVMAGLCLVSGKLILSSLFSPHSHQYKNKNKRKYKKCILISYIEVIWNWYFLPLLPIFPHWHQ